METKAAAACFLVVLQRSHEGYTKPSAGGRPGRQAEVPQTPLPPDPRCPSILDPPPLASLLVSGLVLSAPIHPLTSCQSGLGAPTGPRPPLSVLSLGFEAIAISLPGLPGHSPDPCPAHPPSSHFLLPTALQTHSPTPPRHGYPPPLPPFISVGPTLQGLFCSRERSSGWFIPGVGHQTSCLGLTVQIVTHRSFE